ncbi:helix-turn-helix domain-containing protein [Isoptericola halotolerans]|uniref:Transcriptional regulator with XRE-family HTH domain n=1 Tax=Isoptericola halotolerans TaxID=300560 RepID=A0ABX2A5N7_9MICO|nr:helix-turn-helix transcriptional regulator [Isoptericola halotolerans]NOV98170.1 transcriptional regulator with XRE-family HTH domain [Isoptericola halotolerans]
MGAIWMVLTDRKKLAKLMVIQDVSQRELAKAAGWKSHSYLGRLLRGEVNTLDLEPAVRIAMYLQVGTDDLFMSRSSSDSRRNAKRLVAA